MRCGASHRSRDVRDVLPRREKPLPADTDSEALRFERFEIVPAERVLRVDARPVEVGARAFDLLLALAQRRERLVSRQELLDLVWPGVVVEPRGRRAADPLHARR